MLFSSFLFLSIFLPILLAVYYFSDKKYRNSILLIFSLIFYGWGEPEFLAVMLFSIFWNYLMALGIDSLEIAWKKKLVLSLGISGNLLCLCYFKYMDFFLQNINHLFGMDLSMMRIIMPIGISFYTFQSISYLMDVYRKEVKAERNLLNVGLYISFFPQLVAGPIVKFHEISDQLRNRTENLSDFSAGLQRFLEGLAKKVLIANIMGTTADTVFSRQIAELTTADLWLGGIAYSFQIFFDFSGYSDMAIGLGKMFGFKIPENFNYPYVSSTVTEFWRRWHISLSTWFKEYLYIPLGGSKGSKIATLRNLLIVFAVTGFWHGAGWTFLIWGLWNGFFIVLERIFDLNKKVFRPAARIFMHMYLLLVVLIGWIFFRAENFEYSLAYLRKIFTPENWEGPSITLPPLFWVILIIAALFSTEFPRILYRKWEKYELFLFLWRLLCGLFLILVLFRLAASSYNPFIYFRF